MKIEGEFVGKTFIFLFAQSCFNSYLLGKTKNVGHLKGERASIVHHKDNLKMEGKMESRVATVKAVASEKASQIKHEDNLKLEGSMDMKRRGTITLRTEEENSVRRQEKTERSTEQRSQAQTSFDAKSAENVESRYSSTSNLSHKANQSSGIRGSIHQTGKEEANITAVNRDKFASSLRESSGVILGTQKEMSVIENHRKQSLQKQKLESWDTRVTGYSVGEAHTGRTAAYGGRDYQYSGSSASRSANTASSWASQSHEVSRSHTSARASRQETSTALSSGFKQEQMSGYARNLGNSHSGSALIRADQVVRHEASTSRQEASSSAYQSVAQQSYRAHQSSETRMERTTPSRRRTWAESSLMHGGSVAIGQSIYAQDFHQHSCPASKVYANSSPYKYERQSSSGHKMFAPRDNPNQTR